MNVYIAEEQRKPLADFICEELDGSGGITLIEDDGILTAATDIREISIAPNGEVTA